jgi:hypothetical protein
MSKENRELFIRALSDAVESKIGKTDEEINDIEIPPPSKRHKIQMNRIFRERIGGSFLPFPEEDNIYERMRSKLVIKLKGKEFQNRRGKDKATDKNTLSHPKSRITAKYKKK